MNVVKKIENTLPIKLVKIYRLYKRVILYKYQRLLDKYLIAKLQRSNQPINVVFFVSLSTMWKYDSLYQCMVKEKCFNPIIIICPFMSRGESFMCEELKRTYYFFKKRNWNVIMGYEIETGSFINVYSLSPDIIFYSDLNGHHPNFRITKYRKCLTCYTPYGFNTIPYEWYCASSYHNQLWKFFIECSENAKLIDKVSSFKVNNHVVVGYLMFDAFMQKAKFDPWGEMGQRKRIIWAPHSSIGNNLSLVNFSTFLDYSDYMYEMTVKNKDRICVAFKPHPELKSNLYKHPDWGKERTDAYYSKWANGENTMIADGEYVDLFLTSDALIHDCGSFLVEYLYTRKPCLYLTHEGRLSEMNEIGVMAYNAHYQASSSRMIDKFINDVILDGKDIMKNRRDSFYTTSLLPPNGMSVAENIVQTLKQELSIE